MNTYTQKKILLNNLKNLFFIFSWFFLLNGCATIDKLAIKSTESLLFSGYETFLAEDDIILAKDASASNLKMIDALLLKNPKNISLCSLSGMAYFSYSFGFVEEVDIDRASKLYLRGLKNSIKFLSKKDIFLDMEMDEFENLLNHHFNKYFENFFFATLNFASWMNHNKSDLIALNNRKKIELVANKLIEIHPDFYFGGGYLLLALYNASQPKILGGNVDLAKTYFDKCLETNSRKFLPALYFYAKYYCINVQNKELFLSLLNEIRAFNLNNLTEQMLPNKLMKIRSEKLQSEVDDLFI